MKQVFYAIAIIMGISFSVSAQSSSKKEKTENQKVEMKNHVCTSACSNGNHILMHGEKGHVCTKDCPHMSAASGKMEMKDHACTSACKGGTHMYAHGEKGHTCGEACKKKM